VGGGKNIKVSYVRGRGRCQGCERMVWEDVDKVQVCHFLTESLIVEIFLALDIWRGDGISEGNRVSSIKGSRGFEMCDFGFFWLDLRRRPSERDIGLLMGLHRISDVGGMMLQPVFPF